MLTKILCMRGSPLSRSTVSKMAKREDRTIVLIEQNKFIHWVLL